MAYKGILTIPGKKLGSLTNCLAHPANIISGQSHVKRQRNQSVTSIKGSRTAPPGVGIHWVVGIVPIMDSWINSLFV